VKELAEMMEVTTVYSNFETFNVSIQKVADTIKGLLPAGIPQKVSGRMMSNFHTFRIQKLEQFYSRLGRVDVPDPMLEQ